MHCSYHVSSKGAVQSSGCSSCHSKGFSKGCSTCSKGCHGFGLGLFSWLHAGCGCGTTIKHGGCGCSSGKGSSTYYNTPVYEGPMNEVPTPVAPPTPEPVSTQSAGKWLSPLRFLPLK